jgi:hypothetical protein
MKGLISGFKYLYPCKHCRGHFQKDVERGKFINICVDPPNVDNHK